MIIECSYCEASVDARVLAHHKDPFNFDEDPAPFRVSLLECPRCNNSLLAGQYLAGETEGREIWQDVHRVWPAPKEFLSWHIPDLVKASLEEANACFKARAFSACAVMCGRSIEGICRHFETKSKYLGEGMKELRERGIIDGRLLEWAAELQKSRNLGAHATGEKISKPDARDLLDFTNAICEYTFVLSAKFEGFMERRKKPPAP
jgi:Domain of unknown function (DUF4145)